MALPPSPLAIWDSLRNPYFSTIYLPHPSHHNHNSTNASTSTHPSHSANSSYSTNTTTSTQSSPPLSNDHPHSHFHPSQTLHHLSNYIPHPHLLHHHQHQQPIQTTIITPPSSHPPNSSYHLYAPHHPHHSTSGPLSPSTPSTPPLTIHETPSTYLFTLDVPGTTSTSSITLRWKTPHLLSISGSTPPSTFSAPPLSHCHHLSPPPSTATATTSPTSTRFTQDHEDEPPPMPSPPHSPAFSPPEEAAAATTSPTAAHFTHEGEDAEEGNSLVRVVSHDDPGMTTCAHIAATDTRGPNPYPKYCSSLSESLYQCSVVSPSVSPRWKRKEKGKNEEKEGKGWKKGIEGAKAGEGMEGESRLLLEERRTGQWERDFSFAVQVEREDVKARLEAGVLRIWVRKGEADGERGAVAGWGERGGGVTWVD